MFLKFCMKLEALKGQKLTVGKKDQKVIHNRYFGFC